MDSWPYLWDDHDNDQELGIPNDDHDEQSASSSSSAKDTPSAIESASYRWDDHDNDPQLGIPNDDQDWKSVLYPQEMKPFRLPQSCSNLPQQPEASLIVEPRPSASQPQSQNPLVRTDSPVISGDKPHVQPATPIAPRTPIAPTPSESPMSFSTPLSIYQGTPRRTPTPQTPLTPVTPVCERFAAISAVIGEIPTETVDAHFKESKTRAEAVANDKKRQVRERWKRTPPRSRGSRGGSTSSRREAAVSRTKAEEYKKALENELWLRIRDCLVLSEYVERFGTVDQENARKRARAD